MSGYWCRSCGGSGNGLSPRNPGVHYTNSDYTFVDDADVDDVTQAHVAARTKFAEEQIDTASLVDTRERRQIIGEVVLDPVDFLAERTWPDTVVTAHSNFDSHGYTVHPVFMLTPPNKKPMTAHVPFRAMLPLDITGVVVTGLGMSAHRDALPVVRMQADVQNQGYAAGYAAALAAQRNCTYQELDVSLVQQHLVEVGNLDEDVVSFRDNFPLADNFITEAVAGSLDTMRDTAIVLANAERSLPILRQALAECDDVVRQKRLAEFMVACGDTDVAEFITISDELDDGWNFRGMGQFGFSLSPDDVRLILLAGSGRAAVAIRTFAQQLARECFKPLSGLGHCGAEIPQPQLAALFAELLAQPGMRGITGMHVIKCRTMTGVIIRLEIILCENCIWRVH